MALGDLHFPAIAAPQADILPQNEGLDKTKVLYGCVIVFELSHELDDGADFR